MRKSIRTMLVALIAVAGTYALSPQMAQAEEMKGSGISSERTIGVGLGGGTTTSGLTGKLYLSDSSALQAVVGIGTGYNDFGVGVDYIIQEIGLTTFAGSALDLELGAGVGEGNLVGPVRSRSL